MRTSPDCARLPAAHATSAAGSYTQPRWHTLKSSYGPTSASDPAPAAKGASIRSVSTPEPDRSVLTTLHGPALALFRGGHRGLAGNRLQRCRHAGGASCDRFTD